MKSIEVYTLYMSPTKDVILEKFQRLATGCVRHVLELFIPQTSPTKTYSFELKCIEMMNISALFSSKSTSVAQQNYVGQKRPPLLHTWHHYHLRVDG